MSSSHISKEAISAGTKALEQVRDAIERNTSFKMEAGAGAGKTYTLVETLKFLIHRSGKQFELRSQQIACITFTNIAREEIERRIDKNPIVYCDTIHGFCWNNIKRFQDALRGYLLELKAWNTGRWSERLEENGGIGSRIVDYQGYRDITNDTVSIYHDDVIDLIAVILKNKKFQDILRFRYPVILIDEYQDTNKDWIDSIKKYYLSSDASPLFGFFGDHWQKIYGNGCGNLTDESLCVIEKGVNFRSSEAIVGCLNRMRPELVQVTANLQLDGDVRIFHTNGCGKSRNTGPHHNGDLFDKDTNLAIGYVKEALKRDGWNLSPEHTKILMLTHRALANQQGYNSIPNVFQNNDSFTNKTQPHISFFADKLEPACQAYTKRRYGDMFNALDVSGPASRKSKGKSLWIETMDEIIDLRKTKDVCEIIKYIDSSGVIMLPESVADLECELDNFDKSLEEEMPRPLRELEELRQVPYNEIINLCKYLDGHTPFRTKHGVKGAEYENVLIVIGRGWNQYNFDEMLEDYDIGGSFTGKELERFERNRNLFYVSCSRAKKRLALLFTQTLSDASLKKISHIFKPSSIEDIENF